MTNAKMAAPLKAIAVLAAAWLLTGWGSNWEELKSAAASVTSLSADFVQEKHMQILARPLVSSGVFYFQSPASLRWEYRAPVRNILLMHDNRTERYVDTGQRPDQGNRRRASSHADRSGTDLPVARRPVR